jgi:hypothetical protein
MPSCIDAPAGFRSVLALKLLLVPCFLALISLAGKRWGPGVAGWLAGFPALTGPILLLLALEHGPLFTAEAATVSLSAVLGAVAFVVTYARACVRRSPWASLAAALGVWCCAALVLTRLPPNNWVSLGIALVTLLAAPRLFPRMSAPIAAGNMPKGELLLRMLAGAAVTLTVTTLAAAIGPAWSGMLAVFPVLSLVLAVFSHRMAGPAFTILLLKSMVWGFYAFITFCFTLALSLPHQGVTASFAAAIALAVGVQWALKSRLA